MSVSSVLSVSFCFTPPCEAMDLAAIQPRDLVNTHIVFKSPMGDLQSGVSVAAYRAWLSCAGTPCCKEPFCACVQILRCVQKGRVDKSVVYLVGVELDRARESGSTKNGHFLGYKVLDCEPGRGFVCEEVHIH